VEYFDDDVGVPAGIQIVATQFFAASRVPGCREETDDTLMASGMLEHD